MGEAEDEPTHLVSIGQTDKASEEEAVTIDWTKVTCIEVSPTVFFGVDLATGPDMSVEVSIDTTTGEVVSFMMMDMDHFEKE
jgi:hypothetical protein